MRGSQRRQRVRAVAAALISLSAFAVATLGLQVGAFQGFRQRTADGLFPAGTTDNRVAVVGIDARSLEVLGQPWPWPRGVQAQLIQGVADAGARVIVDDVLLAPPRSGDDDLASAMRRGVPVIVASSSGLQPDPDGILLRTVAQTDPAPLIARAAAVVAHASVTPDPDDGVVRSLPLVVEDSRGHLIPSLALAALMQLQQQKGIVLRSSSVVIGDISIPTGERHSLTISYADSGVEPTGVISAVDVLQGHVAPHSLDGKVAFIGTTDPTLGDTHLVPPNKRNGVSGVAVHASAFNTMLTGSYLRTEPAWWTALVVLVVALITAVLVLYLRLRWAFALVAMEIAAFFVLVLYRFRIGVIADLVYPLATIVGVTIVALAVRYLTELRQNRRVNALFAQYVPATVARQLVDDDLLEEVVSGVRRDVTVFFCDLRGFTPIAAALAPPQVRMLLNLYYEHVCSRILARDGTIMQFVGDEVFAVFGAPVARQDHAQAALEVALEVQRDRPLLDRQLTDLGLPLVRYGIGLHTGEVVAAHVGPTHRRQYAVVGNTVNVGSRLCGQALADQVVAGRAVLEALTEEPTGFEDLGRLELRGVAEGLPAVRFELERVIASVEGDQR